MSPDARRRALLTTGLGLGAVTALGAVLPAAAQKPVPKPAAAKPAASAAAGARKARWPTQPWDMSLGDPNAPVWIVEYLSLTCPHCAHFNDEVFPDFRAKYIDSGRVYYTIRELLTEPAQVAAAGFLTARCNGGARYFPIVDQVFRSQPRWRQGQIKPIFLEIAKANGLTEAQFEACLIDDKAGDLLEQRIRYAVETDKVNGTPTFFINGVLWADAGVPTLPEMDVAIAKALNGRR